MHNELEQNFQMHKLQMRNIQNHVNHFNFELFTHFTCRWLPSIILLSTPIRGCIATNDKIVPAITLSDAMFFVIWSLALFFFSFFATLIELHCSFC